MGHTFDPRNVGAIRSIPRHAARLDDPTRRRSALEAVLELLALNGAETVVDYGAGSATPPCRWRPR